MPTEAQTEARPGPFTWQDFLALADDDPRELIDGHLVEVEVPTRRHEEVVATLIFFLVAWARSSASGARVLASGYKVRVSARRGVMPDVQLYLPDNLALTPAASDGASAGRPDLAVEVVSPSSRRYDRVVKLGWYASLGVPEYWIVDPEAMTLEQLRLEGEHYAIVDAVSEKDTFRPASFAGLEVPLAELWG